MASRIETSALTQGGTFILYYNSMISEAVKVCLPERSWMTGYGVTRKHFERNFGNQLMKHYNDSSLATALDCFSNHTWLGWKFARMPIGFWKKN